MTVDDFYNYITKHMTPEQALKKLLVGSLMQYDKLKFDDQKNAVHPILIISMAAMDLGWQMAIEKEYEDIRGMSVGSAEYMEDLFKKEDKSDKKDTDIH